MAEVRAAAVKEIFWNEPMFGATEAQAVARVLRSGRVSEGAVSEELTERLKQLLGVRFVVLTTSGAAALFLAAKAQQVVEELAMFEVLVPDVTFIASATAVGLAGGTVVLVDVEKNRLCIDPEGARRKITDRTRAVMPVHVIGRGCDMRALRRLATEHRLLVIEDAANALGSTTRDGRLGALGDMGCFSLQANKAITCGHGGFVVTNDRTYHEVIVRIKDFGRFHKDEKLHQVAGFNFKFNDILAAVALAQLHRLPARLDRLRLQRQRYERNLAGCAGVTFPTMRYEEGEVPLYVDAMVESRDRVRAFLAAGGIHARDGWPPVHRNPPFVHSGTDAAFPVSSQAADRSLWLPNGPRVRARDIDRICSRIRQFYGRG